MILKKEVTLAKVQKAATSKPSDSKIASVWWSANTCWWTDDPADLQPGAIPLDSLGSPLFEGDIHIFLSGAVNNPHRYGRFGLEAFMAMHHKNFDPTGDSPKMFSRIDTFEIAFEFKKHHEPNFTLLK